MARVQVIRQTTLDDPELDDWSLWFQWCLYVYDEEGHTPQHGYRFIWKRPQSEGGSLQAARGQARIPSLTIAKALIAKAEKEGWGNYMSDTIVYHFEKFDIVQGKNIRSKRPATREVIEKIKATVLEETAQEVDVSQLDRDGFLIDA
jgi:hypothetical protein